MELGLRHPVRAVPTQGAGDAEEGFELLVSRDGLLVAAVSRATGDLSVMTGLPTETGR